MPKIGIRSVAVMLLGPPGSGKGSVGKHLLECFEIPHISTGDILREHVQAGDGLGRQVKALMEGGQLVPDEMVNELVRERIQRADCAQGFILDGYPRTLEQGQALARLLKEQGLDPLVVYLNVDYNHIVARLTARRSCPKCGMVYNLNSKPPREAGLCDQDGCPVVTRDDDREEVIRLRFEAYERLTRPLVEYFEATVDRFYRVDGSQGSPEEIAETTCRLIGRG
jgi:adenylate kinase